MKQSFIIRLIPFHLKNRSDLPGQNVSCIHEESPGARPGASGGTNSCSDLQTFSRGGELFVVLFFFKELKADFQFITNVGSCN